MTPDQIKKNEKGTTPGVPSDLPKVGDLFERGKYNEAVSLAREAGITDEELAQSVKESAIREIGSPFGMRVDKIIELSEMFPNFIDKETVLKGLNRAISAPRISVEDIRQVMTRFAVPVEDFKGILEDRRKKATKHIEQAQSKIEGIKRDIDRLGNFDSQQGSSRTNVIQQETVETTREQMLIDRIQELDQAFE